MVQRYDDPVTQARAGTNKISGLPTNRIDTSGAGPRAEPLDTLAQQATSVTSNQRMFQYRAFTKSVTNSLIYRLLSVEDSPLHDRYTLPFRCAEYIQQIGDKTRTIYCNCRWCWTCNRIRAAKLMKGYGPVIAAFPDAQFVTLTATSVHRLELEAGIEKRYNDLTRCFDNLNLQHKRQTGINAPIRAIVKLEGNHNPRIDSYNIHFHAIVDTLENAKRIRRMWMKINNKVANKTGGKQVADGRFQNIRPCYDTREIFKYFIKLVTDKDANPVGLDAFFVAVKDKRLLRTYGGIRKVSEDIDRTDAVTLDWREERDDVFKWQPGMVRDWVSMNYGDFLSGYEATEDEEYVITNCKYPKQKKTKQKRKVNDEGQTKKIG